MQLSNLIFLSLCARTLAGCAQRRNGRLALARESSSRVGVFGVTLYDLARYDSKPGKRLPQRELPGP